MDWRKNINPKTLPQQDTMYVTLFAYGKEQTAQFDLVPVKYKIVSYGEVKQSATKSNSFLKFSTIYSFENTGNEPKTHKFVLQTTLLQKLFLKSVPEADSAQDQKLFWEFSLGIGETKTVIVTRNYWPLFVVIVLALLLIVGYYLFRSPITIDKRASVRSTREHGLTDLKVTLTLNNRGKHRVQNVRVIDVVSQIAEFIKDHEMGMLEPSKVMHHDKKGTILKWELSKIDPGEEHIISYRIRTKLSIIGGISLPYAVVKFETAPEIERATKSKTVNVQF